MATKPTLTLKPKSANAVPDFDAQHVTLKCIVDNQPWVDGKPVANGAEVTVPAELAQVLLANKHFELVA
jgi:hypothetical protein